jgi:hypothetical protein
MRFRYRISISRPVKGLIKPKINIQILNDSIKLKELQIMKEGMFASRDINIEDTIEQILNKVKTNLKQFLDINIGNIVSSGLKKTAGMQCKRKPGLSRAVTVTNPNKNRNV